MLHVRTPEQKIAEHPLLLQRIGALEAQLAWFQKQVFGGKRPTGYLEQRHCW